MRNRLVIYNLLQSQCWDYQTIWRYQKALMEHAARCHKQRLHCDDALILLQHSSVYTLGRAASEENLKFKRPPVIHSAVGGSKPAASSPSGSSQHQVLRIERGGEVTWHGPGQLVAYPIFNLHRHKKDLHWYTSQLEQTVIDTLAGYGIKGERSKINTGVWVADKLKGKSRMGKISAVGVTASRWITMHGIALNVNCDLRHFDEIVPCGITEQDCGVCSMQSLLSHQQNSLSLSEVGTAWMRAFTEVFNFQMDSDALRFHTERDLYDICAQYPDITAAAMKQQCS